MNGKPFWASKTLWANAIGLGALAATLFGFEVLDPEDQTALLTGVMAIVNVILRLRTSKPLRLKKGNSL